MIVTLDSLVILNVIGLIKILIVSALILDILAAVFYENHILKMIADTEPTIYALYMIKDIVLSFAFIICLVN